MQEECELGVHCALRRHADPSGLAHHTKRKGELAELIFVLKAWTLGLGVSKPYGDSRPYDFVVESGARMLRVQVKSAFTSYRRCYQVPSTSRNLGGRHTYTASEIDFIAAYVFPLDAWYIIPVAAIGTRQMIKLDPNRACKRATVTYERFREAWDLLAPP